MKVVGIICFAFLATASLCAADCASETFEIARDPAVSAIFQDMTSNVDPFDCDGSGNTVRCGADFGAYTGQLETACDELGGQFVEASFSFTCTNTVDGNQVSISYSWDNLADCVGPSCDPDSSQETLDGAVEALTSGLESSGFTCTGGSGGDDSGSVASKKPLSALLLACATFLFIFH
jgi:hypothetical protein